MHISYTKSFNIPVSIAFATLAHMLNVYEICLNTTNYPIFNKQRLCILPVNLHFETVLVSRYPHHVFITWRYTSIMWRSRKELHFGVIDHDIQVIVVVKCLNCTINLWFVKVNNNKYITANKKTPIWALFEIIWHKYDTKGTHSPPDDTCPWKDYSTIKADWNLHTSWEFFLCIMSNMSLIYQTHIYILHKDLVCHVSLFQHIHTDIS